MARIMNDKKSYRWKDVPLNPNDRIETGIRQVNSFILRMNRESLSHVTNNCLR